MKRVLALLLTVALLAGIIPAAVAAETQQTQTETSTTVEAQELEGVSRLDEMEPSGEERALEPLYAEDDLVTVIVQLEDAAVMDYFGISAYSLEAENEDVSAGAAVSAFLTSEDAQALSGELLEAQDDVLSNISGVVNEPSAASAEGQAAAQPAEMELVAQWTTLVNAVAVKVPYGKLDEIQNLDGVKRAYVERTYARPEEPVTEAGAIAGYSYDMVGIQQVWNAGYTGKGMLVAVLDTGLDLNWQAYADPHIVSVHEAFTEDSFKSEDAKDDLRYDGESLAAFLEENTLNAEFGGGNTELTYDYNALYKNLKVPFAYDYADLDLNVKPTDSDHGTHVSGTIAGYAKTEEGVVEFSGVAPDAQILSMKIFPDEDGGALESDTIDALEDALKLGADVINLSLGSDNGFAEDDTAQQEMYAAVRDAGIVLVTSAGNADDSDYQNNYGGNNLTADPETSMVASPAVYASNLAVASINNTVDVRTVFTWTDSDEVEHKVAYLDPTGVAMKYKFVGQEPVSVIPVGGIGTYSDYSEAGFRSYYGYGDQGVTGIALVQRGELSFVDKIKNAENFIWSYTDPVTGQYVYERPVQAVLVYDNEEGSLVAMGTDGTSLTSAFISKADGEAIVAAVEAGCDVKITVEEVDELVEWDQAKEMSEFTSWGAGPGLELKPEITAPGGNIWSSILGGSSADGTTGSYGMMSGTSMAAPHVTGITALVEQYVQNKKPTGKEADADLTERLLVSTAVPQKDGDSYYSPRRQGAGLVNAAAAIQTPAYITVDGQRVGKLELKDDPNKTGSYTLTFNVNNMTDNALTYEAKAVLLRPDTATVNGSTVTLDSDVVIQEVELGSVTVSGNASVSVSKTVSLTGDEKAELDRLFENGTYVEGFVILTDATESGNPQIGLPFLAFYGDWTAAPIFDRATWLDEVEEGQSYLDLECTWSPSVLGYFDGYSFYNLGQNPFDSTAADTQTKYLQENVTISPSGLIKSVNDYELYQLRDAKLLVVEVRDKATGELYYRDFATYQYKTLFNANYACPIPVSLSYFTDTNWSGTDLDGNVLPSGTQCVYTITAYGDGDYGEEVYYEEYELWGTDFEAVDPTDLSTEPTFNGHAMDKTGDVISFDVMVDTEAPKLVNNAVSVIEEDGRTYITGTFMDEGSIASVEIQPLVKRSYRTGYGDPNYFEYGPDVNNPFYVEYIYDADVQEWFFKADVTEYAHTNESFAGENYYFSYEWTGNVYIYGGDYGGNDRTYAVTVDATPGLVLSTTSALLYVGQSFDLSVNNNTEDTEAPLTRSSSNPAVATVDEYGHVVALAPGQTTITISNGTETVVCIVAVRERPTEVLDFDLSIENFEGLKPNGEIIVKVTNLYPADVELSEVRWEVSEDDETAEDYEGLINCVKYTVDGLSGQLYLNYSAYDPYNMGYPEIPGGSGTLTVTLNGVSRSMTLSWEDLWKTTTQEDLISDTNYNCEQTVYVTQGETATLVAKYNDITAHDFGKVALYTAEGYEYGGSSNPQTPATGLVLDGPDFYNVSSYYESKTWTGKLVNQEGYALPESIRVLYRYDYGYYSYENELTRDAYYNGYTYNSTTGEINVPTPSGSSTILVIRADGVVSEGNPAGELSGSEYETPASLYGPFDWAATEGAALTGTLTTAENVSVNYSTKNVAYYTPAEPGVSYITATSKDGQYSVNFAVVCEPVKAERLELESHGLTLNVTEMALLKPVFQPEPTLDSDKELIWESFNPEVATVSANGVVTGRSAGYAFIKVSVKSNTDVYTYCIVTVNPSPFDIDWPSCPEWPTWSEWPLLAGLGSGSGISTPTAPMAFTDVSENAAYYDAVKYVYENGLMNGVSDTRFAPASTLTRAMVVTILYRIEGEPSTRYNGMFRDVANYQWYTDAVEWAAKNNIVTGYTSGKFGPEDPVTREQLAAILYRYALSKGSVLPAGNSLTAYADGSNVSSYAVSAVKWAVAEGILEAQSGKLQPRDAANRAQVAIAVAAFHQKYVK
ncbi:MAG: S8 family serine peptidase [Candidatus Avoscillospira sp.]